MCLELHKQCYHKNAEILENVSDAAHGLYAQLNRCLNYFLDRPLRWLVLHMYFTKQGFYIIKASQKSKFMLQT